MNKVTLTEEQVNQILSYLAEKPYKEVYSLVGMIQSEWQKQHTDVKSKEGK